MRSAIRFVFVTLLAMVAIIACSSGNGPGSNTPSTDGTVGITVSYATGKTGMVQRFNPQIVIPGGENLNTVTYNMTDGAGHTYSGSADVTSSTGTANFIVAPVAAAVGYTVTVTGTTTDALVTCSGVSGAFTVVNRQTTNVALNLYCVVSNAGDGGAVDVNGTLDDCPYWNYVVATNTNIPRGGTTTVYGNAVAPGTTAITFTWSVSGGGALSGQASPDNNDSNIVFTCPAAASSASTITLVVSDASSTGCPALDTTSTTSITCN